ncbi:pyridoxal phosphate-dependent aminotransferase [Cysteiniphilum halobium]|uniref:pyridoxal phosphate-dependent aminotransferase n=1 Tax=Cysteiniphilum halobium TaxID=2219059 RepID=UPI000E65090D|nr:pyridoxal phosphate-dependent aminotransferase [Cysteiniphilum halobium]
MLDQAKRFSQRVLNVEGSKAAEMAARAVSLVKAGHKDVISLAVGEPGFHSPNEVKEAAKKAIDNNLTQYTPVDGIVALKDAIVRRYQRDYQFNFQHNEVCVTTGAKHSLYNIFNCILNEGDEVLFFSPFWTSYPDMIKLAHGKPVIVKTDHHNDFQPTEQDIRAKLNTKTKALVLNIPHNPTGAIYHKETLSMIARVLKDYPDVWVISDDIYDMLYWGERPLTLLEMAPELKSRYAIVNGVSKSYAMAGWRIGYIIAPDDMINMLKRYQSQSMSCACSISQYAAIEALNLPRSALSQQLATYQERVNFCYGALQNIPEIDCLLPQTTFYLFPYVQPIIDALGFKDDLSFCLHLLETKHLAVMPGSAFGASGYLRLSCADEISVLRDAMQRLVDYAKQATMHIKAL